MDCFLTFEYATKKQISVTFWSNMLHKGFMFEANLRTSTTDFFRITFNAAQCCSKETFNFISVIHFILDSEGDTTFQPVPFLIN